MTFSRWLVTLIKVSRRLAEKEQKFIVVIYRMGQCWNIRQYLIVESSSISLINSAKFSSAQGLLTNGKWKLYRVQYISIFECWNFV